MAARRVMPERFFTARSRASRTKGGMFLGQEDAQRFPRVPKVSTGRHGDPVGHLLQVADVEFGRHGDAVPHLLDGLLEAVDFSVQRTAGGGS